MNGIGVKTLNKLSVAERNFVYIETDQFKNTDSISKKAF